MNRTIRIIGIVWLAWLSPLTAYGRDKPAPPPSRYGFVFVIDAKSLPKGVTVREVSDGQRTRHFVKNTSDIPLIVNARYQDNRLVTGNKLVSGKVYHYFPNGVPIQGKTHLKGWQAPFGEMSETLLSLPKEPPRIAEGRKPGLSNQLPPPESYSIPASYGDKPLEIKGTVRYHLNKAYDAHYQRNKPADGS